MRLSLTFLMVILSFSVEASRSSRSYKPHGIRDSRRVADGDKSIVVGDLSAKISKRSGRITLSRRNLGVKRSKDSTVKISIDSLKEKRKDGKVVGRKNHKIDSFNEKDFTFGVEEYNTTIGRGTNNTNTNATTDATAGVKISYSTTLSTGSVIGAEMIFISKSGEVGTPTEFWVVQPGDMKFNIALSNWAWCDPCAMGVGDFVDIEISISGSKKLPKAMKKNSNKTWDLGDGAILDLSEEIMLDGAWVTMPDGYPQYMMKGGSQVYTLRIPRFNETALYDPVVSFDQNFNSAISRTVALSTIFATGFISYLLL